MSFESELLEYRPRLRLFALKLCKNNDRADDLVQNTILRALVHRDKYKEGTNIKAWLTTILRNEFYSEFRRIKREVPDVDGKFAEFQVQLPDQIHHIDFGEAMVEFDKLVPEQRLALDLIAVQGMSYEEAAEIMDVPPGTVKSRVSRGRASLAKKVGPDRLSDSISIGVINYNDNFRANPR